MKKFIAIMLAMVILLSFAACKNNEEEQGTTQETVSIDVETLKADWQTGDLLLPDGKIIKFPCKVSEFIEQSGFGIGNEDILADKVLAPEETVSLNIFGEGTSFKVVARNTTDTPELNYKDANIIKYVFNNTNEGNRKIRFAGTLTPGGTRSAVEEALGIPKGQTSEDTLYYYEGKNSKRRNVKLTISFNSDDIVNSVSYEIIYN